VSWQRITSHNHQTRKTKVASNYPKVEHKRKNPDEAQFPGGFAIHIHRPHPKQEKLKTMQKSPLFFRISPQNPRQYLIHTVREPPLPPAPDHHCLIITAIYSRTLLPEAGTGKDPTTSAPSSSLVLQKHYQGKRSNLFAVRVSSRFSDRRHEQHSASSLPFRAQDPL
jgi:hypothetical protein